MVNRSDENHWQTDAITTIDRDHRIEQDVVYDLQGRRMDCSSLKSGLYIVNGRKVLVK
jgi:energy-converting hydrogenase A subunit M